MIDKDFIGSPLSQKDKDPEELELVPNFVLSGIVQESLRIGLEWVYYSRAEQDGKRLVDRGDLGLNVARNLGNIESNDQARVGVIELGFN